MNADPLTAGIAWTTLVDDDVQRILDAPHDAQLEWTTVDAFLFAAARRLDLGDDLRAHLFRIRSAYKARRVEIEDLADARDTARTEYPTGGGYAALPWPLWPHGDPWADAEPEPCL